MIDPLARKKHENAAAYIISMWHLEDLLRANGLDLDAIENTMVAPLEGDEDLRASMRDWYTHLVDRMHDEGVAHRGHLTEVEEVLNELEFLHRTLLDVLADAEYKAHYAKAEPGIRELQEKAGEEADGPVATCLTAIYGVMVLRAADQPISPATQEAETHFRALLTDLSEHYRHMRKLPGVSMN